MQVGWLKTDQLKGKDIINVINRDKAHIRDVLKEGCQGLCGLAQHVLILINQFKCAFLYYRSCMQWGRFCKQEHQNAKVSVEVNKKVH